MLEACRRLDADDFEVTYLPVDRAGRLDPAELRSAIREDTTLVSIMLANAETHRAQPITELAAIAADHGALFHTDAAQAVGKVVVHVEALGVDLLTVVGHTMYARRRRRLPVRSIRRATAADHPPVGPGARATRRDRERRPNRRAW